MIKLNQVTKRFGDIRAVDSLTLEIPRGEIFGLVGTNGAGKSTLLRMIAGILKPDSGTTIHVDGAEVYENPVKKSDIYYIPDEAYFFANATGDEMAAYYKTVYPDFDENRFRILSQQFSLETNRKIQTFSKGMKKQLCMILGLCAGTKYLLCDETFDGLDPVMRQAVKSLIAGEIMEREFTPVIASHNLREMEDICEKIGLLHRGGMLLAKDIEDMKQNVQKVQCVVSDEKKKETLLRELNVLKKEQQGSLLILTVRGTVPNIEQKIKEAEPLFSEVIPLSLEEIFISETEVAGYEIKNLLL